MSSYPDNIKYSPNYSHLKLQKIFAVSPLIRGVIEEVELNRIKLSPNLVRGGSDRFQANELGSSIRQNGLLQPIIIRMKNNSFEIVAGNRRYKACKNLGWRKILCHIVELEDKEAFEFTLIENIQRKTLDALEEATAFKAYVQDFGWGGVSELASKISKSPSYVCKRLSVLNLPAELLKELRNSTIKASVVEELIPVQDQWKRLQIAKLVIQQKLSSRATRQLVKKTGNQSSPTDFPVKEEDPFYHKDSIYEIDTRAQRSFDKSITALKVAMSKIASVIENVEDNWIVYEILMQHKNMLNSQIDLLIKEKKKL